jgi:uncharacterized membrane protein YkvA (DUF1232 family)
MIRLGALAYLLRLGPRRLLGLVQHLPSFLRLFWRLFKDPRVGIKAKLLALGAFAYLILPADLVPDLLPALGHIDDLLLLFLGAKGFIALSPPEVVREHVQQIAQGR